jgi:hypothetical protein
MEVGKLSTSGPASSSIGPLRILLLCSFCADCWKPGERPGKIAHRCASCRRILIALQLTAGLDVSECQGSSLPTTSVPVALIRSRAAIVAMCRSRFVTPARSRTPTAPGSSFSTGASQLPQHVLDCRNDGSVPSTQPTAFGLASLQEAASLQPDTTTKLESRDHPPSSQSSAGSRSEALRSGSLAAPMAESVAECCRRRSARPQDARSRPFGALSTQIESGGMGWREPVW